MPYESASTYTKMQLVRSGYEHILEKTQWVIAEVENLMEMIQEKIDGFPRTGCTVDCGVYGVSLRDLIGFPKIIYYYHRQLKNCRRMREEATRFFNNFAYPRWDMSGKEAQFRLDKQREARIFMSALMEQVTQEKQFLYWAASVDRGDDIDPAVTIIVSAWRRIHLINDLYRPENIREEIAKQITRMKKPSFARVALCQLFFEGSDPTKL